MTTVEKEALDDFSSIFQENYDKIPEEQGTLADFFSRVNVWYYKEMPEDMVKDFTKNHMYQYTPKGQTEFLKFQSELSAITKAVYLVVKDVSEIAGKDTESYQKSDYVRKEGDAEQGQRQVINVNTGKPSIWHRLLRKKPDTNIPQSLEDAWIRSENWKEEIRNIPNIWRKLIVWHHYGVRWQKEFNGYGMEDYRDNEVTYMHTRIEPLITNIVSRALDIRTDVETAKIERIYTGTLQLEKELETARLMTGQQENPQPSP